MRKALRQRLDEARAGLVDERALETTLGRLVAEGDLSPVRAEALRTALPGQLEDSRYVLGHLGAHLAIGAVFAFDLVPLPLGTLARVSWVAGARTVETARGHRARARVHSAGVFLIAAVPWLGYATYLLPLSAHPRVGDSKVSLSRRESQDGVRG